MRGQPMCCTTLNRFEREREVSSKYITVHESSEHDRQYTNTHEITD